MIRELGAISDLQAAEALLANSDCTIGFDATTQEDTHLNSVHITTKANSYVIAADELPGGTAEDYHLHICESVDNLEWYQLPKLKKSVKGCWSWAIS